MRISDWSSDVCSSDLNSLNARFAVRGLAAGVTTYFSDAPCCGGIASAPFMDIASTQVLNGPQGTLFGRSSAAGAVLIYPQRSEDRLVGNDFVSTFSSRLAP